MKHLFALVLCCLLLAGCGRQAVPNPTEETRKAPPTMLYDPDSLMEAKTQGALRAYPLPLDACTRLMALENDLLVLSGEDTLTRLAGEAVYIQGSWELGFSMDPEDPSLAPCGSGLSYFDPVARQTVILNEAMEEVQRIPAPQDLTGTPVLSQDGSALYYCSGSAIRCWQLDTGIRRLLRELPRGGQTLTGIYGEGQALGCVTPAGQMYLLSTQDGRTLWEGQAGAQFAQAGDQVYAAIPTSLHQRLLFGRLSGPATLLSPKGLETGLFLEHCAMAVTMGTNDAGETVLSGYDLSSGRRSCEITLGSQPLVEDTASGLVYLLAYDESYDGPALYRWDPAACQIQDSALYTSSLDSTDLTVCQSYARSLEEQFGVHILLGQEAADASPWDYDCQALTQPGILWQQLQLLEQGLGNYPKAMLEQAIQPFGSLTICLVESIQGLPESGSVDTANGVQFTTEDGAFLALAAGPGSLKSLSHELFHVMETVLLSSSTAFDQWENLNPKDFAYANSYTLTGAQSDRYLQGENRAFLDRYSMSYPKEDRARVMEYAMTPGKRQDFSGEILQEKLKALCTGIRDAFHLEEGPYLWEQYLEEPIH